MHSRFSRRCIRPNQPAGLMVSTIVLQHARLYSHLKGSRILRSVNAEHIPKGELSYQLQPGYKRTRADSSSQRQPGTVSSARVASDTESETLSMDGRYRPHKDMSRSTGRQISSTALPEASRLPLVATKTTRQSCRLQESFPTSENNAADAPERFVGPSPEASDPTCFRDGSLYSAFCPTKEYSNVINQGQVFQSPAAFEHAARSVRLDLMDPT